MVKYPQVVVKLVGTDGNAFALIGKVSKAMQQAGLQAEAVEFRQAAFESKSYDDLLQLILATVDAR